MTVSIFRDKKTGDYAVQTTCLTLDDFVAELSEALFSATNGKNDGDVASYGVMKNAMPIAFKLAGYKADEVSEQRTLMCGNVSPHETDMVSNAGRR